MASEEQRAFLERNRLVIVGLGRKSGPPHLSPVYYVMDGDDILISTMESRFKAKAVRRNPEISLCVIGEQMPFPYLLIYGTATIEDTDPAGVMMKVGEKMSGNKLPDAVRPAIEERAKAEGRVVLRVKPQQFSSTLPLAPKKA